MEVLTAIELFLDHRRAKGLSIASLELYRHWLTSWSDWRKQRQYPPDLPSVEAPELLALFRYLQTEHVPHQNNPRRPPAKQQGVAVRSAASCWRILRACWYYLAGENLLTEDQRTFFARGRVPCPKERESGERDEDADLDGGPARIDDAVVAALVKACGVPVFVLHLKDATLNGVAIGWWRGKIEVVDGFSFRGEI